MAKPLKVGTIRFLGRSDDGRMIAERIKAVRKSGKKYLYTTSFPFYIGRRY